MINRIGLLLVLSGFSSLSLSFIPISFASSPSFSRQIIRDDLFDWIDLDRSNTISKNGDPWADILAVTYLSNDNILNCTLWLVAPYNTTDRSSTVDKISYGMWIDTDLNRIPDYRFEIQKFKHRNWTKVFDEYEPLKNPNLRIPTDIRFFDVHNNYTGFFSRGHRYVNFSVNLNTIGAPSKYKIIFYAEERKNNSILVDYTKWINIPPPELIVKSSPNPLILRQGDHKTIQIQLNSTSGFEPTVNIIAENETGIKLSVNHNKFTIPSYGIATLPLTISADSASTGPHTIPITINYMIPDEPLYTHTLSNAYTNSAVLIPSSIKSEQLMKQSSLTIWVDPKLSFTDQFLESLSKLQPLSILISIVTFFIGLFAEDAGKIIDKSRTILKRIKQKLSGA